MKKNSLAKSKIFICAFLTLTMLMVTLIPASPAYAATWPTLKSGSSGTNAYALQYLLNYWGAGPTLTVDGAFGANTDKAVKNFQKAKGLSQDGVVGTNTWIALTKVTQSTSSYSANPTKAIQHLLRLKFGMSSVAVDGVFGSGTRDAVIAFQKKFNLTADGVVGPNTWNMLISTPAQSISPSPPAPVIRKVFYQSNYSNIKYGYKDAARKDPATVASSGCGLLALTNAIYYLNGKFIEPENLARFSLNNGHRIDGVGTNGSTFYPGAAAAFGPSFGFKYVTTINVSSSIPTSFNALITHLRNGNVAIASVPGHLLAVVAYDDASKKYLVLDSAPSAARGTSNTSLNGYVWMTQSQMNALKPGAVYVLGKR
jgi:peptidoglycan hydrolase-like protein with peptidoglycan-binding domain